ncbi:hypothetical protein BU16DRAFT_153254 [Lophium mytilinum]|uniref:Extracellular membrane protein CFEM domain-containing protein n=1 Tax=Lophium mytilinum TaxID=390894 RepID=A0A6A6QDT7_9PEZI|nr:hypothetical protein BU16DRAFT_153254 [Lophium mytilinum]
MLPSINRRFANIALLVPYSALAQLTSTAIYPTDYSSFCTDPSRISTYDACITSVSSAYAGCSDTDYGCLCPAVKAEFNCMTAYCPQYTGGVCAVSKAAHDICVAANMAAPTVKDYACPSSLVESYFGPTDVPSGTATDAPTAAKGTSALTKGSKAPTTAGCTVAGSTPTSTSGAMVALGSPMTGTLAALASMLVSGFGRMAVFL